MKLRHRWHAFTAWSRPFAAATPTPPPTLPTGEARRIAIVDAYDDPVAAHDLAFFSAQFGLPFDPDKFKVVYASGTKPATDPSGGWEVEEALDIEYAHAMAPHAMIYLVEAATNSFSDLFSGGSGRDQPGALRACHHLPVRRHWQRRSLHELGRRASSPTKCDYDLVFTGAQCRVPGGHRRCDRAQAIPALLPM